MKQLDVDQSPPANIRTFRLGLTNATPDLDPRDLRWFFSSGLFSSDLPRQTDRQQATLIINFAGLEYMPQI